MPTYTLLLQNLVSKTLKLAINDEYKRHLVYSSIRFTTAMPEINNMYSGFKYTLILLITWTANLLGNTDQKADDWTQVRWAMEEWQKHTTPVSTEADSPGGAMWHASNNQSIINKEQKLINANIHLVDCITFDNGFTNFHQSLTIFRNSLP